MVLPQTRLTVKTFALPFPTKISAFKLTDACLCIDEHKTTMKIEVRENDELRRL
jgi:hypothetical protein